MERCHLAIFFKPDPRSAPFNQLRPSGQKQTRDSHPFDASRQGIREDGSKGLAVLAIHLDKIGRASEKCKQIG